jgi:3-deoxy-D-manno-octulosonic-acid transferase
LSQALRQAVARGLYATGLRLAVPLWLARLWWRGAREPLYRAHLAERLGFGPPPEATGAVWVHAVSLGETRAASALVQALRARVPGLRLLLTHGTATGREAGRALLQPGDAQAWLPIDTPGAVRRFLARHRPAAGVLMETEVWPVLLHEAQAAGVPMVLANARLSPRSLRRGQRHASLLRPAVACLRLVLAQTDADAQRLRAMGAHAPQVCGNLKFDLTPDATLVDAGRRWRAHLARPVVLAAVTREGEEEALLRAWQARVVTRTEAGGAVPGEAAAPLLVIVPRHPQRFDEVAALVQAAGLALVRRSAFDASDGSAPAWSDAARSAAVWLGDTLGEMSLYYGLADVALLGGSFEPLGGQNLIEAAACGCPVVMGPHTFNFAEAAELARQAGAARRVGSLDEGVQSALGWLAEPTREADGARARAFAEAHRGAAARMAEAIERLLAPA